MKKLIFAGMVLALGTVNAIADCSPSTKVNASILAGQSINASGGGENWKESHCGSGNSGELWKVGAPAPLGGKLNVDPPKEIGTWSVTGKTVTYSYFGDSSSPYMWTLHQTTTDGPYSLCSGSTEITATLGSPVCSAP